MSSVRMQPIAIIAAFAMSNGVPADRIAEATGLGLTDLFQSNRRVSHDTVLGLWRCIADALPGRAIGLELAAMAPFEFYGPLLHVASYAETLRDALEAFVRYRRLLATDLHLAIEPGPDRTAMVMSHPLDEHGPSPGPEVSMGLVIRFAREVLRLPDVLVGVDFVHQPMAPPDRYAAVFGVPVRFGRPAHRAWIRTDALDEPTGQGDAYRFAHLTTHLDLLHRDLLDAGEGDGLATIRAAIAHNARRGEYGAAAVAQRLGTSLRSLQRTVRAGGTTLKALLDDARERHARRLLGDARLSTDEIAFLLGYSSESAFRRAFRRWTGRSPAEIRRAQAS